MIPQVGPSLALHLRIEKDFKRHCEHKYHGSCYRDVNQIIDFLCRELLFPCKNATTYVMTAAAPKDYASLKRRFALVVDKSILLETKLKVGQKSLLT